MGGRGAEGCAQGSSRSCWDQLKSSLGSPPGRMWDSSRWMEIQARQGKPHNAAPLRASVSHLFCREAEEEGR